MRLIRVIATAGSIASLLFVCCADLGTTLDVGNPSVSGIMYKPDGVTPACGAKVVLFERQAAGEPPTKIDSVVAGEKGLFSFDHLKGGLYSLEGNDADGNIALVNSIPLPDTAQKRVLPPDTLKRPGVITGKILLTESGDPRKVDIQLFETIKSPIVDADGGFVIGNLAEARYTLRFKPSLDNYGIIDTVAKVVSGDTTDIGVIAPPFLGVPTPKNVAAVNDPARQTVTITWSRADTSVVSGYVVYRRPADSSELFSMLNYKPISDAQFRDSTVSGNLAFEYRVSCVSKKGDEGAKSGAVTVLASSFFDITDVATVCEGGSMTAMTVASSGSLYISYSSYGLYQTALFDSSLSKPSVLNFLDRNTIHAASDSTLYGSAYDYTLVAFDAVTTRERIYPVRLTNFVAASGNRIVGFTGSSPDSILVVAGSNGTVASRFPLPDTLPVNGSLAVDKNDNIFLCGERENAILVFSLDGKLVRSIPLGAAPLAVTVDDAGRIAVIVRRLNGYRIEIYNAGGTFLALCNLAQVTPCSIDINGIDQCALVNNGPTYFLGIIDPGISSPASRIRVVKITFQMSR